MQTVSERPCGFVTAGTLGRRRSVLAVPALLFFGFVIAGVQPTALAQSADVLQSAPLDCGDPPSPEPAIPDGRTADRATMLAGIRQVREFSKAVDDWLSCKDRRAAKVFQWMNEEERARWDEDIDKVHRARVEVQRRMNEQIRTFNERQKAGSGNSVGESRTSRRRRHRH